MAMTMSRCLQLVGSAIVGVSGNGWRFADWRRVAVYTSFFMERAAGRRPSSKTFVYYYWALGSAAELPRPGHKAGMASTALR